ncbi:MAG: CDP-alcohol phosphatidyltransferase family protein [Bowdeniella nasicola]|nr:CDP-alcohol phosphatidyltransferase family protein [Bowdeniella nasicola]
MLGQRGRGFTTAVFGPVAKRFVAWGISPNTVTIVGTAAVVIAAFSLLATGHFIAGSLGVGLIVFTDSIDGQMARLAGTSSAFGAFLDSTLDRIADAAIFLALAIHLWHRDGLWSAWAMWAAVAALPVGAIVSYARARAEAANFQAAVGIAERSDRLLIALAATLLVGLGLPMWVLAGALSYLVFAGLVTITQRIVTVFRQAREMA